MASTAVNEVIKLVSVETKSKLLYVERMLTYVYIVFVFLEIPLLGFLLSAEVNCIPQHASLDVLIAIASHPPSGPDGYLAGVCAAQIKWKAFAMFLMRIFMLFAGTAMLFVNGYYVRHVDADLTDDGILQNRALAYRWLAYKFLSALLVVPLFVATLVTSYTVPPFWQLLTPLPIDCSRHMIFDQERTVDYICHVTPGSEFWIFMLWIFAQFFGAILLLLLLLSIGMTFFIVCNPRLKCPSNCKLQHDD